jgi:DNA polymerase
MRSETAVNEVRAAESLLSFWVMAGVDTCLGETPVDRTTRPDFAPPAPRLAPQARAPVSMAATVPAQGRPATADVLGEARILAREAEDLDTLETAIAAFDGCPLKTSGARQAVFARGAPDAPVMVIGEAPGAEEDIQGAPFVGRAGQLLDRMIAAAGLEGRVFITNTVFWRPPGNRTPTLAEQQVCAPFLERAIALVRPRVLLLVGAAAAKSVLGVGDGILSIRGRWFEWRGRDGGPAIPTLPTLHPAFLLRQPAAKKKAWADMLTLAERVDELT